MNEKKKNELPTNKVLLEALGSLGWDAEQHGDNTVRVSIDTNEGGFTSYIRTDSHWLVASIVPFLATQGDNSFELSRWLLRMNRDMYQVKFAYDEDGDVVMTVELPMESIDRVEIESALKELLEKATKYRNTLRVASGA